MMTNSSFFRRSRMARLARIGLAAAVALGAAPAVTLLARPASAADAAGPLAQLRQSNEKIDRLLKAKDHADTPRNRDEMKAIVNGLLAYDELARRSLAQHWDGLSSAQRDTFVGTLRELIEKNYVRQLRSNLDYDVVYKDEAVKGEDATVSTVVKVRTKGKSTDTSIDYKMKKLGARWVVYDVINDEVSMVQNYRSTFHKTITTESFDGLVKKMKTKIAELDAPKPAPK